MKREARDCVLLHSKMNEYIIVNSIIMAAILIDLDEYDRLNETYQVEEDRMAKHNQRKRKHQE